jgi:peptide/nickel transport system permease protein
MSLSYVFRRLAYILLILLVVALFVFGITQVLPGNAAVMILGEYATPQALHALEQQLGLNRPVALQFTDWLGRILIGDWGTSLKMSLPVLPMVATAFSRSAALAVLSLLCVLSIGIPLGVLAGANRKRTVDVGVSLISYLGISLPEFVTATLLLVFLANPELGWFPAGGYVPLSENFWSGIYHLVLPVITMTVILVAHLSRQIRSELVDVLETDYVRTAVLKGLPRRMVIFKHALRNALAPAITVIALDIGYLIGGIIVVEEVFAYPGIGRLLVFAIQNRDLPLMQGAALIMAGTYALANLAADLVHAFIDPRVQYG